MVALSHPACADPAPAPRESVVFTGGKEGYACYRTPALAVSAEGTVLAMVRRGTEEDFVRSIRESASAAWGRVPQTLITGAGGR